MNRRSHLQILGPEDTAFYYVDRPETPMNIGALCIIAGKLPFDEFIKVVEARIFRAPLYQQRVIQAPLNLGQPSWVLDPDFYVGNHVFRVDLPAPGTEEQLREFAGHLISGMLDRSKPLWEIYVIDGLEGDRSAILFKVHHCMVDGLAAVELFTMLMDMTPEVPPEPRHAVYDPPYLPNATELVTRAIRSDLPHRWHLLKKIGGDVGRLGGVLADKEKRRQTFVGVANLINDNLSRIKGLPINGQNTGRLTLAWTEFPLAEVKAIRATESASVNEVMLSVLGGGLSGYLSGHAYRGKQEFLRLIVPVTMRQEEEKDDYGNRISVVPIDVPLKASDPRERLRKVRDYSQVMKHSSLAIGLDIVLTLPSLYPSFTQPLIWGLAPKAFTLLGHSWCTNVAGPPIPVYVLGHQMLHSYGYFPLNPSMGLACVILSYNERITMTLIADAAIIPDVTDLRDHLLSAYTALRQAARVPEIPLPAQQPVAPAPTPAPSPTAIKPAASAPAPSPVQEAPAAMPAPALQSEPVTAAVRNDPPIPAAQPAPAEVVQNDPPASVVQPVPTPVEAQAESAATALSEPPPAEEPKPIEPVIELELPQAEAEAPVTVPSAPEVPVASIDPPLNGHVDTLAAVEQPAPASPVLDGLPREEAPMKNVADADTTGGAEPLSEAEPAAAAAAGGTAVASVVAAPPPAAEAAPPVDAQPAASAYTNGKSTEPPKLFSEAWALAYQNAINASAAYRAVSKHWEAGQLAFIIHASPRHGFPLPTAVLLDLYRGECRAAHNTAIEIATGKAAFVIEGDYDAWQKVLRGESDPLRMLMRGGLRLSKGSMFRLLPFTQSAQELVHSAQNIS